MKKEPKKISAGSSLKESKGGGFTLLDLALPFLMPVKGIIWIGNKLKETADAEITDKSKVQEELLNLQMRFEMEEVSEEEYQKKETKLLERLEAIRKYEEEKERR